MFEVSTKLRLGLWRFEVVVSEVDEVIAGYSLGRSGGAFCSRPKGRHCWQCKEIVMVVAVESNDR